MKHDRQAGEVSIHAHCVVETEESLGELVGSASVDSQQGLSGLDLCPYLLDLINAHREVDEIRCLSPATSKAHYHATDHFGVHLAEHSSMGC